MKNIISIILSIAMVFTASSAYQFFCMHCRSAKKATGYNDSCQKLPSKGMSWLAPKSNINKWTETEKIKFRYIWKKMLKCMEDRLVTGNFDEMAVPKKPNISVIANIEGSLIFPPKISIQQRLLRKVIEPMVYKQMRYYREIRSIVGVTQRKVDAITEKHYLSLVKDILTELGDEPEFNGFNLQNDGFKRFFREYLADFFQKYGYHLKFWPASDTLKGSNIGFYMIALHELESPVQLVSSDFGAFKTEAQLTTCGKCYLSWFLPWKKWPQEVAGETIRNKITIYKESIKKNAAVYWDSFDNIGESFEVLRDLSGENMAKILNSLASILDYQQYSKYKNEGDHDGFINKFAGDCFYQTLIHESAHLNDAEFYKELEWLGYFNSMIIFDIRTYIMELAFAENPYHVLSNIIRMSTFSRGSHAMACKIIVRALDRFLSIQPDRVQIPELKSFLKGLKRSVKGVDSSLAEKQRKVQIADLNPRQVSLFSLLLYKSLEDVIGELRLAGKVIGEIGTDTYFDLREAEAIASAL